MPGLRVGSIDVSHALKNPSAAGESGTRNKGKRDKEIRERTADCFRWLWRARSAGVRAARVAILGVENGHSKSPTNPPANSRFLRFGSAKSNACKRKNPGKFGVFASIRNAKGSLNELRNRRFQVRPLTGANSTAAVILDWIPAAVSLRGPNNAPQRSGGRPRLCFAPKVRALARAVCRAVCPQAPSTGVEVLWNPVNRRLKTWEREAGMVKRC
jgi:hypothetical protein